MTLIAIEGRAIKKLSALEFVGRATAPSVSKDDRARLYYDTVTDTLLISKSGGAYEELGGGGSSDRLYLEGQFNDAYTTAYSEKTYAAGVLTNVDIWDTDAKVTKLFSKTFTYNSDGYLATIALVDEVNSNTLTTTLTYDSDNEVATISKAVT